MRTKRFAHELSPQERKEIVLQRLENALYLRNMYSTMADDPSRPEQLRRNYRRLSANFRAEAERLKGLKILQ